MKYKRYVATLNACTHCMLLVIYQAGGMAAPRHKLIEIVAMEFINNGLTKKQYENRDTKTRKLSYILLNFKPSKKHSKYYYLYTNRRVARPLFLW